MFRRLVIAFIIAVAALLETAADAIAAMLPLRSWTVPGCGWSRPGGYASGRSSSHRRRVTPGPLPARTHLP
jgi:hypothetical protein